MKQLIKTEFRRAFSGKPMCMALLIGLTIAVSHVVMHVLPLGGHIYDSAMSGYPLTVFQHWMGGENVSLQPVLYYLVVPLLCSMPYLSTFYSDKNSGYIRNIFVRADRNNYFTAKYVVTFLSAGFIAVIPLVVNFLLSAMILPAALPQAGTGLYSIGGLSLMGGLFYAQPYLYLLAYMAINFVFFGLLVTIGLLVGYVAENIFVVILSPFILYLLIFGVTQLSGAHAFCPFAFLRPSQPVATSWEILTFEVLMLLVAGGVYFVVSRKKEIY